ncbi:LytTR family DNA-binding domain-containing protein [Bacteroides sp. 224]|uniref:LytR/AlgR family response regulator transcription factor n=1 Tax=Bacteroides sp. 224 TaxID=2302936 RepID=UPI0013D4D8FE|nr:LytTR family DNA-binding domain-containing protein [Bacteroides sp. 224]NDV63749.1 DNA-binding response regulator [Bacteroides sp. 224]
MEEKIYALIIDDEAGNRENLRRMLEHHCPQVTLLGECASVKEASLSIVKYKPDLIFLDICLPDGTGFTLLENLREVSPEVIFVTAFDQYAIQAIRFSALDYLLKPIDFGELIRAVDKAVQTIRLKQQNLRIQNLLLNSLRQDKKKKIALSVADKIEFVEVSTVIRCEAESNYTTFYLVSGEKLIVSRTLKEYDELLTPYGFLRVHQSHLINPDEIRSFVKSDGGYLLMNDGSSVSISRQRRNEVMEALKLI